METSLKFEAEITLPILMSPKLVNPKCASDGNKYVSTETGYYCPHCGDMGWWTFSDYDYYP